MLGLASGAILVPLNSTMLAVALPSVMGEFQVGAATVASLVTLYLGAVAIALPASGSLGDRFGHRRVFLVGVAAFALASALAATAVSFEILALSRVLQAASGALVSTSSVALIRAMAPADRRGSAFGLFDMLVSTSAAIGPLIGGLLVAGLGWRSLFVVAVPVALFAALAVGALAPPQRVDSPRQLLARSTCPAWASSRPSSSRCCWGCAGWRTAGRRRSRSWRRPSSSCSSCSSSGARSIRRSIRDCSPSRPFAAAVVGIFGATVILHATLVLVPLLVERLQGGDAQTSGFVLLGISALGALAAPIGGRVSDAVGRRRPAVLGTLASVAGLGALWLVAPQSSTLVLGLLLAVVGFGMGMAGSPRQTAALELIEPERVGMAAGTYLTGRYIGGALGATLAGAVLGGTVTAAGVSTGFGILAAVAVGVALASLFLPARRRTEHAAAESASKIESPPSSPRPYRMNARINRAPRRRKMRGCRPDRTGATR